jgi:DNA-binding transcriptional ArsR family regulator
MVLGTTLDGSSKITLDQDTFKVLASETRIDILKNLDKSQLTVSDLARAMNMSKATLFEHLDKMVKVGIIKKVEDKRKWVYYKLTWKGKNILHPERIKIAIVLSVIIAAFVIFAAYFILISERSVDDDINPPVIEIVEKEDLNQNTESPRDIVIKVTDDDQVDKSSLIAEYTIDNRFLYNYDLLHNWYDLDHTMVGDKINIKIPNLDYSLEVEKYLYIKIEISDKSGNNAEEIYIEFIERVYQEKLDLSITEADFKLPSSFAKKPAEGIINIPLKLAIHNTGLGDIQDIIISFYDENPDKNGDGIEDNSTKPLKTTMIHEINHGEYKDLEIDLIINLTDTDRVWVFVDPFNNFNESSENNNLVNYNLKEVIGAKYIIPEFPIFVFLIIVIILLVLNIKLKQRVAK